MNNNPFYMPTTIEPNVLNLDFSELASPTSSFQQLDSSSPGWSSATSVIDSPCGPLAYGDYDLGHMNAMIDSKSYYGPAGYSYDCHAESSWASGLGSSDSFWEEPPQILKSNHACEPAMHAQALQYRQAMMQSSLGGLGLPSGTMSSSPAWTPDHINDQDVKATPSRNKRNSAKTSRRVTVCGRQCDVDTALKPKFICEISKDGTPCGKKFARKEHRKRHWDAGCKNHDSGKTPPQCVIALHCAASDEKNLKPCGELHGNRPDNMRQHIATHLKGSARNKSVNPDFLFYCLVRHDKETGVVASKAAAAMDSAFRALKRDDNATSIKIDRSVMERHAWYQDYLRDRESTHPAHRSAWRAKFEQMYREKAWPGAVLCTPSRNRTSKL
jgi:hypothetical protein